MDLGFIILSEWINASKKMLEKIKLAEEEKDRDRLELVKSTLFLVRVLQRSMWGWMQWLNNADVMARFSQEELEKINKRLSEFTRSFIDYDLEVTKLGERLGLKSRMKAKG